MKTIFYMLKVKSYPQFERVVYRIIKQVHASQKKTPPPPGEEGRGLLFHCYVCGDIFRISTAVKVQDFDFSHFKSEEIICNYIAKAIDILRQHIPAQDIPLPEEGVPERRGRLLFDDYTNTIGVLR